MTRRTTHHRHHRRLTKHPAHNRSRGFTSRVAVGEASLASWTLQRRSRARWFFSFLVFATLAFLATQAFGQAPFKTEKLDPTLLEKARVSAMEQSRKEGTSKMDFSPQWERYNAFDAYYKKYVFGKLKDDAYVAEYGAITQSLLDDLERSSKQNAPAAPIVRKNILDIAKQIAPANYHPAARINATLLLAMLDDAPENPQTKKLPVPSAEAFLALVQLYRTETNPDGVRAAALQGIARHVALGSVKNPQFRAGVSKMMTDLVNSDPPAGRSAAAHAYLQRYAVDILSVLANPNGSADTAKTLVALSTDKDNPNLIAAYAAAKISALQPGKQKLDQLPEVLKTWAARAADTFDGEIARIAKLDPPTPVRDQPAMPVDDTKLPAAGQGAYASRSYESSGMEGADPMSMDTAEMSGMSQMSEMYDMGGMDPMGMGMVAAAKPQPLEVITARRRINHVLQQLQMGVTGQVLPGMPTKPAGLLASAAEEDKETFETWVTTVSDVVTAVNANTLDDRKKFVEELAAQSAILRGLSGVDVGAVGAVGAKPVAGAPVAPAMAGIDELDGPAAPPAGAAVVPAPAVAAPVGPAAGPAVVPAVPAPGLVAPLAPAAAGPAPVAAPAGPAPVAAPAAAPTAPPAAAPVVDELQ